MANGYNIAPLRKTRRTWRRPPDRNISSRPDMSKDNIQDVVKKSLEKYFKDLGEQMPSNVYEMVVFTVEKPILEAVMERAGGNQSQAADMLGINRNTLRKKLQQHGLL
jgi:Fis family transcriptional regulator